MKQRDRSLDSSRTLSVLASCVLLSLALIGLSQMPQLQPVRGVLETAVAPIQHWFSQTAYGINSWAETLNSMHTLDGDIARLREENARLQTENAGLLALRKENDTLRQMLGFQLEFPDLHGLPASIVGRDPSGLSRSLTIDRGADDGVAPGMAVTSPGGFLLGRVQKVTSAGATVLLIDDIDSSIPVVIDRTNVQAVVQGQAQHGGRLLVRHIVQGADVGKGDLLKTSGLGGSLPKGLLLGQIYQIHQKDIEEEQQADAYPLAPIDSLDQVLVITGSTSAGTAPRPLPAPGAAGTPGPNLPFYPVPATATAQPTRTPIPTITPLPTATSTPVPKKKG